MLNQRSSVQNAHYSKRHLNLPWFLVAKHLALSTVFLISCQYCILNTVRNLQSTKKSDVVSQGALPGFPQTD